MSRCTPLADLTPGDRAAVVEFGRWLALTTTVGGRITLATDPEWRAYAGLPPTPPEEVPPHA